MEPKKQRSKLDLPHETNAALVVNQVKFFSPYKNVQFTLEVLTRWYGNFINQFRSSINEFLTSLCGFFLFFFIKGNLHIVILLAVDVSIAGKTRDITIQSISTLTTLQAFGMPSPFHSLKVVSVSYFATTTRTNCKSTNFLGTTAIKTKLNILQNHYQPYTNF